jgi:hypothetical protein
MWLAGQRKREGGNEGHLVVLQLISISISFTQRCKYNIKVSYAGENCFISSVLL